MRQKVILFSDSSVGKPLELFGANDGITADTGHNIVADGGAGVSNPLPTFPTCTEPSKTLVFPFFDSCSRTNGQTDRPTDRQSLLLIMELRGYGIL